MVNVDNNFFSCFRVCRVFFSTSQNRVIIFYFEKVVFNGFDVLANTYFWKFLQMRDP